MPLWQRGLLLCWDLAALKAVHHVVCGLQSHATLIEPLQDDLCEAVFTGGPERLGGASHNILDCLPQSACVHPNTWSSIVKLVVQVLFGMAQARAGHGC